MAILGGGFLALLPLDLVYITPYIFRMHKTTLYLDEAVYQRIRELADAKGQTQAYLIREAIERYVFGGRPRRPRSIGLGAGSPDLSERAEEFLSGMGETE